MSFWRNVLYVICTYGLFFFIPWLGAFRLLAEMADDNAITHWQNSQTLSKKGHIGTFLLAVFLLIVAGEILAFHTIGFPLLVFIECIVVLTYSIGFDITNDLAILIILGLCTVTKIGYCAWKYFLSKHVSCAYVNGVSTASNSKDNALPLPSVNLSLSDMEEIPIENDNPDQQ